MNTRVPTPLPIRDRPVRLMIVGLGQVSELVVTTYVGREDVEIVGLCDRDPARVQRWAEVFPKARTTADLDEMLTWEADVVDVLVPTPAHGTVATKVLTAGFHVQLQKPIARSLEETDEILAAAAASGAQLRILEDYLFFPPIVKLKEVVDSGEIGRPVGVHMKLVGTGAGGWDVPMSTWQWQFEQTKDGRGMLVFDHGWHQLAVARWLFGPVTKIFAWTSLTEIVPGIALDAPSTLVWEHENGVRAVLEILLAPETYFRSDWYTGDERIEVTGTKGYVRCNRISAFGVQEPSVEVYHDGEVRAFHALDDLLSAGFVGSTEHGLAFFRGEVDEPVLSGAASREVLVMLMAALESAQIGRPVELSGG